MYQQLAFQNSLAGTLDASDRLEPLAAELFERAYRPAPRRKLWRWFARAGRPLRSLAQVQRTHRIAGRHHLGLRPVALEHVRGSMDRTDDFDGDFRPVQRHSEARWLRVATAMLRGTQLPPIEVVQIGDTYFVQDGHHRISVARVLGYRYLDAVVEVWDVEAEELACA